MVNGFIIDGKLVFIYIFGMNYYWMMGDNWYNFVDLCVWGFVLEDYIVGCVFMVWFFKSVIFGM